MISVKASRGDTHLGGQDIDQLLVKHCMNDFKAKTGIDLETNKRAKARIRNWCQRAKHYLSDNNSTLIEVEQLSDEQDYSLNMTRAEFDRICDPVF